MGLHQIQTHTGKIFYDTDRKLEFLTVGDYGKENNIKANFLGYTRKIDGVHHSSVDLKDKWVATISTQKGCPMMCNFCDVPRYGFYGNASMDDLRYQVVTLLDSEKIKETSRFNLHYARMGEPSFNNNVLDFTEKELDNLVLSKIKADTIHPVISTMLPSTNKNLRDFLQRWCEIKEHMRDGEAGLQFSINSTDDTQRDKQFNFSSLSLSKVAAIGDKLPTVRKGRKYTLNFAVTSETILDAKKLNNLFDKEKFIVKLTPIHSTMSALENRYNPTNSYSSYDVYNRFEQPLLALGWDVIVFVPSKEEDEDRITCGNALICDKEI